MPSDPLLPDDPGDGSSSAAAPDSQPAPADSSGPDESSATSDNGPGDGDQPIAVSGPDDSSSTTAPSGSAPDDHASSDSGDSTLPDPGNNSNDDPGSGSDPSPADSPSDSGGNDPGDNSSNDPGSGSDPSPADSPSDDGSSGGTVPDDPTSSDPASDPPAVTDDQALANASTDADQNAGSGNVDDTAHTCSAGASPAPAPGVSPTNKPPGTLIVLVLDSSGNPVDGADVSIKGPTDSQGKTATDPKGQGRVEFNGLVDGAYTVAVSANRTLSIKADCSSPVMQFRKDGETTTATGSGSNNVPAGGTVTTTVNLPPLTVTELSFTGDFPITAWAGTSAASTTVIADPVWKLAGNPDLPVCYQKKSTAVVLSPKIKVSTESVISAVPVVSGSLEDKVEVATITLSWSYSWNAGGAWSTANNSGPHKVYQVYATPKESPLYELALQKTCGKCSDSDMDAVASKVNKGIKTDLTYDPSLDVPGNPLDIYKGAACQCINNADLLRYLVRSIGIDADVVWIWGGSGAGDVIFYYGSSGKVYGSFRVLAPANGMAVADPHFTFHAETKINNIIYDPSYGNVGLITLNETAPTASRQTGASYPPASQLQAKWKCPH